MATSNLISGLPALFQVQTTWAIQNQWRDGETLAQTRLGGFALWLVEAGELHVDDGAKKWVLHEGDMLLWPPGRPRMIHAGNGKGAFGARWLTVGLCANFFGHLDVMQLLPAPHQWHPGEKEALELHEVMNNIVFTAINNSSAKILLRDGFCRVLVALLWQMLREEDLLLTARQTLPGWLQKTLAYAQAKPGASVSDLAHVAAFSPAQFRRAFAKWMKISPRQYLQNQRIETARTLLEQTDLPVSAISEQLHFASATHFGQAWKRYHGISPATYRERSKKGEL